VIDREKLLRETSKFVEGPEIASFYIGKTGPDLRARLSDYDHKDAGRWEGKTIIGGLVEEGALDFEEYLCLEFRHPKYDGTPIGNKYYGRDEPHHRSAGGGPRIIAPYEKKFQVYVAWRTPLVSPSWRESGNQLFLHAMRARDDGNAPIHLARTDEKFRRGLETDTFFLSMRIRMNFHVRDCKVGLNAGRSRSSNAFTGSSPRAHPVVKVSSPSFVRLYRWAQEHRREDQDEANWQIHSCCKKWLAG
jgi:hypothetical protein